MAAQVRMKSQQNNRRRLQADLYNIKKEKEERKEGEPGSHQSLKDSSGRKKGPKSSSAA